MELSELELAFSAYHKWLDHIVKQSEDINRVEKFGRRYEQATSILKELIKDRKEEIRLDRLAETTPI